MAEKTAHLPESQNVNRSWRRISTGKLNFLYSEEKILPNYLRSSTGSCHDVCKYGRKHESEDKPRVLPLKRVNISYIGTLKLDSLPPRKKASTKSVLTPSLGCGIYDFVGSSNHAKTQVRNISSRDFDVNKKNADGTKETAKPYFSESGLADSTKPKKKRVSKSFKTIGSRSKQMVEHSKRVTALKLKSVAQSAAMALRRSSVNRKEIKGKTSELKKSIVPLTAPFSSKRCPRILKSNPLTKSHKLENEKCKDLVEDKNVYVIEMKARNEVVESDKNQGCFIDSTDESIKKKNQEKEECIFTESDDESSQGTNFSNDKGQQHQPEVVLKHQDTQNKRDSRVVLYNNVIEETANKLVETRKRKVKALVSAFESVISLQERKTSATT